MKKRFVLVGMLAAGMMIVGCKKKGCTDETATNYNAEASKDDGTCEFSTASSTNYEDSDGDGIADVYEKIYGSTNLYIDGDFLVIETDDNPDHGSPFYPESHALYEAYNGTNTNFSTAITLGGSSQDPDIESQALTFRIPTNASAENTSHPATSGGPIGIGINGVVIYNQYNGAGTLLDDTEFDNTDQYSGHPSPSNGQYHYHIEPAYLTTQNGEDALVGFLLDGHPLYGPKDEDGTTPSDLDAYHGHSHVTTDYPEGIYHYHCTDDAPWINGDGYWGVPGTITM